MKLDRNTILYYRTYNKFHWTFFHARKKLMYSINDFKYTFFIIK